MLYRFGRWLFSLYFKLFYRWRVEGTRNLPARGPFIVCANHINWIDPPLVACAIPARFPVNFMAKEELFRNPLVRWVLRGVGAFPIKRDKVDYTAVRTSLRILSEGKVLGLFPEGTRSKTGEIQKAHNGAAMIALKSDAPVVPVAIRGPYRVGKPLRVYIGKPFNLSSPGEIERKKALEKLSEEIMGKIGVLLKQETARAGAVTESG